MKRICAFSILLFSVLISQAQGIKDLQGNYVAEVDIIAMITGFNPESFEPQIQIADTFAFAELEKNLSSPKENASNNVKVSITDRYIILDAIEKKLEFNPKYVKVEGNKYIITTKENEQIIIIKEENYIHIDYCKNKLVIKI